MRVSTSDFEVSALPVGESARKLTPLSQMTFFSLKREGI